MARAMERRGVLKGLAAAAVALAAGALLLTVPLVIARARMRRGARGA